MKRIQKNYEEFLSILLVTSRELFIVFAHYFLEFFGMVNTSKFWNIHVLYQSCKSLYNVTFISHWITNINLITKDEIWLWWNKFPITVLYILTYAKVFVVKEKMSQEIIFEEMCVNNALYSWIDVASVTQIETSYSAHFMQCRFLSFLLELFFSRPPLIF